MMTQQEILDATKKHIIDACKKVHAFLASGTLTDPQIREAILRELTNAGHTVRKDYMVNIIYASKVLEKPQRIDLVVDQQIGICLVRGDEVSQRQRDLHRQRIAHAGLPLALVITMAGKQLRWKQIDVPKNRKGD